MSLKLHAILTWLFVGLCAAFLLWISFVAHMRLIAWWFGIEPL